MKVLNNTTQLLSSLMGTKFGMALWRSHRAYSPHHFPSGGLRELSE